MTINQKVLEVAAREYADRIKLGIYDDSQRVKEYFKAADPNSPGTGSWCAAFVYWCLKTACKEMKIENRFPAVVYVPTLFKWADEKGFLRPRNSKPEAGDVFLRCDVGYEGYQAAGHTGFVDRVEGTVFLTYEGNTTDAMVPDKDTVGHKARPLGGSPGKYWFRFIDTAKVFGAVPVTPEPVEPKTPIELMHQVYIRVDTLVSDEYARERVKEALNRFNGNDEVQSFYNQYR